MPGWSKRPASADVVAGDWGCTARSCPPCRYGTKAGDLCVTALCGSRWGAGLGSIEMSSRVQWCWTALIVAALVATGCGNGAGRPDRTEAVNRALADLKSPDPVTRRKAAGALGNTRDARAVQPLIDALKDENFGVRAEAARALGGIGDNRAFAPLVAALKESEPDVRDAVCQGLGQLGNPRAIEHLTALADDENERPIVRDSARAAIEEIKRDERGREGEGEERED